MQELLPPSAVRDMDSYDRIVRFLKEVRCVSRIFETYVKATQESYIAYSDDMKECCDKLQDECLKSSVYSHSLCEEVMQTGRILVDLCGNLHDNAEVVMADLKRVRREEGDELFESFLNHLVRFRAKLKNYLQAVDAAARKELQSYNDTVEQLDESLKELRALVDPLIFYNTQASKQYSRDLQDKYQKATERQSSLKISLQELQNLKQDLQVDLEQTKKAMVSCLRHYMSKVKDVARELVENYLWKRIEKKEPSRIMAQEGRKGSGQKRPRLRSEEQLFEVMEAAEGSTVDCRYFVERCERFLNTKAEILKQHQLLSQRLQKMLNDFLQKVERLQRKFNEASRKPFGVNKIDRFKKDMRKYFGERIFQVFELMIVCLERPTKLLKKLSKAVTSKIDRLAMCITEQQNCTSSFERQAKQFLKDCKQLSTLAVPRDLARQTTDKMKLLVDRYDQTSQSIQARITLELNSIVESVEKQSKRAAEQSAASSKNDHINRLVDSQVMSVIKECDKFTVFYDGFFTSGAQLDFRSKIDTPTYCNSNRILAKKEDIHQRMGSQRILCCFSGKQTRKNQFECQLLYTSEFMKGAMLVVAEGVEFESNNGIFSKKVKLMIPKSDILNAEKRQVSSLYSNAILLITEMGEITFANFDNPDIVVGLFHNRFQRKQATVSQSGESSSIGPGLGRGHTPSTKKRFRMSESSQHPQRINTSQTIKAVSSQLQLHSLIQEWFGHSNFFDPKLFTVRKQQKTEQGVECQYDGLLSQLKVVLKERKLVKRFQNPPSLGFTFSWKIVFVQAKIPSVSSNLHVTLQLRPKKILMRAQPVNSQKPNYFLIQFRQYVQTMIENFGRFVSRHFNGNSCEIHLDQQSIEQKPDETEMEDSRSMHSNLLGESPRVLPPDDLIRMSDGFMMGSRGKKPMIAEPVVSSQQEIANSQHVSRKDTLPAEPEPKPQQLVKQHSRNSAFQQRLLMLFALVVMGFLLLTLL